MPHKMRLNKIWFDLIKQNIKNTELRLNDEKRQALRVGDEIEFVCNETEETISRTVARLEKYDDFNSYFSLNPSGGKGFKENDYSFMRSELDRYYYKSLIEKYGVLAIYLRDENKLENLKNALYNACSKDTCYPNVVDDWNENNRFRGHCAVVALILNDKLGGRLCKAFVKGQEKRF